MFGAYETNIQFPTFIPVHLTYQTAFVDDQGKLEFREDIYGRDQALLAILKGTERKVADIPIQRQDSAMRRQLLAMPDNFWGAGDAATLAGPASSRDCLASRPLGRRRSHANPWRNTGRIISSTDGDQKE